MNIKILGSGCKKCQMLYDLTKEVAEELKLDATFEKVTEIKDIMSYGIMGTPGLVVNEKVEIAGKLPSKKEIVKVLEQYL